MASGANLKQADILTRIGNLPIFSNPEEVRGSSGRCFVFPGLSIWWDVLQEAWTEHFDVYDALRETLDPLENGDYGQGYWKRLEDGSMLVDIYGSDLNDPDMDMSLPPERPSIPQSILDEVIGYSIVSRVDWNGEEVWTRDKQTSSKTGSEIITPKEIDVYGLKILIHSENEQPSIPCRFMWLTKDNIDNFYWWVENESTRDIVRIMYGNEISDYKLTYGYYDYNPENGNCIRIQGSEHSFDEISQRLPQIFSDADMLISGNNKRIDFRKSIKPFIFVIAPDGRIAKKDLAFEGQGSHSSLAQELGADYDEDELDSTGYGYVRGIVQPDLLLIAPGVLVPFSEEQKSSIKQILSEIDIDSIPEIMIEDSIKEYSKGDFKQASILSPVQEELAPEIWNGEKLRHEVSDFCLNFVEEYLSSFMETSEIPVYLKRVILIGSITGYQYDPDADLDINISIDLDELSRKLGIEKELLLYEMRREVGRVNGELYPGTEHPANIFLSSDDTLPPADGIYDFYTDSWIKKPGHPGNIDPYANLRESITRAEEIAAKIDAKWGAAERTYREIERYSASSLQIKRQFLRYLKSLERIEKNVVDERRDIMNMARDQGIDPPQTSTPNVVYKYLEYNGLLDKLHKAHKYLKQYEESGVLSEFPPPTEIPSKAPRSFENGQRIEDRGMDRVIDNQPVRIASRGSEEKIAIFQPKIIEDDGMEITPEELESGDFEYMDLPSDFFKDYPVKGHLNKFLDYQGETWWWIDNTEFSNDDPDVHHHMVIEALDIPNKDNRESGECYLGFINDGPDLPMYDFPTGYQWVMDSATGDMTMPEHIQRQIDNADLVMNNPEEKIAAADWDDARESDYSMLSPVPLEEDQRFLIWDGGTYFWTSDHSGKTPTHTHVALREANWDEMAVYELPHLMLGYYDPSKNKVWVTKEDEGQGTYEELEMLKNIFPEGTRFTGISFEQ